MEVHPSNPVNKETTLYRRRSQFNAGISPINRRLLRVARVLCDE